MLLWYLPLLYLYFTSTAHLQHRKEVAPNSVKECNYSQLGNITFPAWERNIPSLGINVEHRDSEQEIPIVDDVIPLLTNMYLLFLNQEKAYPVCMDRLMNCRDEIDELQRQNRGQVEDKQRISRGKIEGKAQENT